MGGGRGEVVSIRIIKLIMIYDNYSHFCLIARTNTYSLSRAFLAAKSQKLLCRWLQDLTLFIRTPKITFFLLKHAVDANALLTLYTVIRLPQQSAQSFRQASSGQFDI